MVVFREIAVAGVPSVGISNSLINPEGNIARTASFR